MSGATDPDAGDAWDLAYALGQERGMSACIKLIENAMLASKHTPVERALRSVRDEIEAKRNQVIDTERVLLERRGA
jgi:hypothetical protein